MTKQVVIFDLFELFTLEAFDRMDWIYYPREESEM